MEMPASKSPLRSPVSQESPASKLAQSPSCPGSSKKLKQMRLPFTPIPKAAPNQPHMSSSKKRKSCDHDGDGDLPIKKPAINQECENADIKHSPVIQAPKSSVDTTTSPAIRRITPIPLSSDVKADLRAAKDWGEPALVSPCPEELPQTEQQPDPSAQAAHALNDETIEDIDDEDAAEAASPAAKAAKLCANDATPKSCRKLTPKQVARRAEIESRRDEREKKKHEARMAKEMEKQKRDALKEQARLERDLQKKAKEEEKARLKREKDEQKEVTRKDKEMKDHERRLQEETEKKKAAKAAQSFIKFFLKKDCENSRLEPLHNPNHLTQFRVKENMRLAPLFRTRFDCEQTSRLDSFLADQDQSCTTYLELLKGSSYQPRSACKTWPSASKQDDTDDEVHILDYKDDDDDEEEAVQGTSALELEVIRPDDAKQISKRPLRAKLLQFCENQRPPYWGTWTKRSKAVTRRKPFGRDEHFFDYEYDSDDDWEEEEQGESLSDEEKDKEDDDPEKEDDDDDGFFVGHGVLDKEELHPEDSDEGEFDQELEVKKQRLRAQQFEKEHLSKKPIKRIKPKIFGCYWATDIASGGSQPVREQLSKVLAPYKSVRLWIGTGPIPTLSVTLDTTQDNDATPGSASSSRSRHSFPDDALPDLVRLVHANTNSKVFLAKEFSTFWKQTHSMALSCNVVLAKIKEVAQYQRFSEAGPVNNIMCWVVKKAFLDQVADVRIPNDWIYVLKPNPCPSSSQGESAEQGGESEKTEPRHTKAKSKSPLASQPAAAAGAAPAAVKKPVASSMLITNFTKVLSDQERRKSLQAASKPHTAEGNSDDLQQSTTSGCLINGHHPAPEMSSQCNPKPNAEKPKKRIQLTLVSKSVGPH